MSLTGVSRLAALPRPRFCGSLSSGRGFTVRHDRRNLRFTATPSSGAGSPEAGVLLYRFTGESEVHLMSTFVPEELRGRGVAALLSQAAVDFLLEEKLRARVSCWYVKKFMEEHQYRDLLVM